MGSEGRYEVTSFLGYERRLWDDGDSDGSAIKAVLRMAPWIYVRARRVRRGASLVPFRESGY